MTEEDKKVLKKIRSRGWLITIPRKYNDEVVPLKYVIERLSKYTYFVLQVEKGAETGYIHYQVYLEHSNPITKLTLVNLFPMAHIEERLGSIKKAYEYCTKEDTRLHGPFEFGERPEFNEKNTSSGKREMMIIDISNGASDLELLMKYPTLYNKRIIEDYRKALGIKDYYTYTNRDVQVFYISGSAGSGKSSLVRRLFNVEDIYVVSDYEKDPFGSYDGQDVLVFEEYRSDFNLSVFLQYLDRYPIMLPARYQNKVAKFTKVFIISNWDFTQQYEYYPSADKRAFYRRISYVFRVLKDYIVRFKFEEDLQLKKAGGCYNPIGQFYELFPKVVSFDEFMEVGFND